MIYYNTEYTMYNKRMTNDTKGNNPVKTIITWLTEYTFLASIQLLCITQDSRN